MKKVIVTVLGGCVTSVLNSKGQETDHIIIDYDNQESGECPVCRSELKPYGHRMLFRCPKCGYDEDKDNAIECAVKWIEGA